jgi:hypothetical protein
LCLELEGIKDTRELAAQLHELAMELEDSRWHFTITNIICALSAVDVVLIQNQTILYVIIATTYIREHKKKD